MNDEGASSDAQEAQSGSESQEFIPWYRNPVLVVFFGGGALIILVCIMLTFAMLQPKGSAPYSPSNDSSVATYEDFTQAIKDGKDCPELFEIRNSWDPKSVFIERANAQLQAIGCYSSKMSRTDR